MSIKGEEVQRLLEKSILDFHFGYWVECSEKTKSFNLKIPQPDSKRRHSPDFRTVFEIMIGPISFCEIGKTWGTNKKVNKQKLKFLISTTRLPTMSQSWFQNNFWNCDGTIFLLRNWQNVMYIKWEKALGKMRKSEKTTFQ